MYISGLPTYVNLVEEAGLGDGVEDDAVAGDERGREDGLLLHLHGLVLFVCM